MTRRYALLIALVALVAVGVGAVAFATVWSPHATAPDSDQTYPDGAGPDRIDFSALANDDANVSHAPRKHWDSYAVDYAAPADRRLVEGEYHIDSATGEILEERWDNGTAYIDGSTYAFVQPADSAPEHRREQLANDPQFVYDDATDAYYRYDPRYGELAPTNLGRHPDLLEPYAWTATNTTTHHGVPVITYRVSGERPTEAAVPPAVDGTLRLGAEDGVVYAFDLTLDGDDREYRYAYTVRPAPFPDHGWVDTARTVAHANESADARNESTREALACACSLAAVAATQSPP